MKYQYFAALAAGCMLLTACGKQNGSSAEASGDMQYIKSSVTYDVITDMYLNPDNYLGKQFHIVGTLYPSTDHDGKKFYSVYAPARTGGGEGIGLELDWQDFSGLSDNDRITVEGTLERTSGMHGGVEQQYLILRVSSLEKRES